MMNEGRFRSFGSRERFSLEVCLIDDPDPDLSARRASAGSWGAWKFWVRGLNLTEHRLLLESGVISTESVTWYLAPLFRWLAHSWMPLLHEERLPSPSRRALHARAAYLDNLRLRIDDTDAFTPWQSWAARHSVRWASEGGLLPDVFLRRVADDIEFSWGDRVQPGGEAAQYSLEPGVAHVPVAEVAGVLEHALDWAVNESAWIERPWHVSLRSAVSARPDQSDELSFLAWFLDGSDHPGPLTTIFEEARDVLADLGRLGLPVSGAHFIDQLSPAVAMFGALSPEISDIAASGSDIAASGLLAGLADCRVGDDTTFAIDRLVEDKPAWRSSTPWEDGYALALDFLEEIEIPASDRTDLEFVLERLEVSCRNVSVTNHGPIGVAVAGPGLRPTIMLNVDHLRNHRVAGRRFTLAHELCHLLYDRGQARRISHSSTPWAPASVEQRANAFAAMLLMPPETIRRTFRRSSGQSLLADVRRAASAMNVGLRAAIQHLANLAEISDDERQELLDQHAGAI